ncbi:MAG: tellurite resistance TerB family protein [Bradymonadia bacterium]
MGLLSRLTKGVTPQKKVTDDVLLLHSMLLMAGADGVFDDEEIDAVRGYFGTLPEFKDKSFEELYQASLKLLKRYNNLAESVASLGDLSTQNMKDKCFLIAVDIAMSTGDVDETEDAMLESMQRVLQVDDGTATKIIEVMNIKYAKA